MKNLKGVRIGTWWYEKGEYHAQHNLTGVSWASDSKEDAIDVIRSQHRSYIKSVSSIGYQQR